MRSFKFQTFWIMLLIRMCMGELSKPPTTSIMRSYSGGLKLPNTKNPRSLTSDETEKESNPDFALIAGIGIGVLVFCTN